MVATARFAAAVRTIFFVDDVGTFVLVHQRMFLYFSTENEPAYILNKAVIDRRLRPRCCYPESYF